jgi:protein-serine/threonine kinase
MVLKQLSHPFIVNLNTFLETPKHTYLLLDFCPGGDLFYHMRKVEESERKRFSENTVKFYV